MSAATEPAARGGAPVIELERVSAGYGDAPVLRDVALEVRAGEVVALLGANGAGKSTTLRVIGGELPISAGEVRWLGAPARGGLDRRAREGLGYVTEEKSVIMELSTRDNLRLGQGRIDRAIELFPALEALLDRRAGLLSGGEQQMLTLARVLAASPKALVIDELSLGLAPVAIEALLPAVRAAAERGAAVLLVEQAVQHALEVADRGYVMRRGSVEITGSAAELRTRLGEIERSYLASV